ncbi:ileal sodium/bile acid cotransporter-like isoform X2 [Dermacentor albipictus]|uniref:ileal sodium/bile acid cotransporter-like isoform X2 n=1 Tax=Dermacentor albipictus TaxID=60249 RepID=UPI0031FC3EDB
MLQSACFRHQWSSNVVYGTSVCCSTRLCAFFFFGRLSADFRPRARRFQNVSRLIRRGRAHPSSRHEKKADCIFLARFLLFLHNAYRRKGPTQDLTLRRNCGIGVLQPLASSQAATVIQLWAHLRRPFGVAVGMLCQFVMMPLLAFGLLTCMRLSGLYAIGMLIMACCPGGTVSNVFAYFVDGDVPLSIAMTLCSTVLAMGMMPVNMLMYGYYVDTGDIVVPYSKMAMSLVFISLPAALGMLFNWFCPRVAPYITKLSSTLGGLLIVVTQIMEVFIFPDIFHNIPPVLYAATVVMPAAGMMIGYLISWLFKRPDAVRKTIAIESGIQNVGMGLTIVSLSFKFQVVEAVLAQCRIVHRTTTAYHLQTNGLKRTKASPTISMALWFHNDSFKLPSVWHLWNIQKIIFKIKLPQYCC